MAFFIFYLSSCACSAMDTTWKRSTMCLEALMLVAEAEPTQIESQHFRVAAGLSDIKIIGLVASHCQNTLHQRDASFQTFPSAKLVSEARNSTNGSLAWPRDSNKRPKNISSPRVLSSRSSEDPTQSSDIYSKISQTPSRLRLPSQFGRAPARASQRNYQCQIKDK